MNNAYLNNFCIQTPCKFSEILNKINKNLNGIVFIADKNNRLIGSISDGDIRRKILQKRKVVEIITDKFELINKKTIYADINDDKEKLLKLFLTKNLKLSVYRF